MKKKIAAIAAFSLLLCIPLTAYGTTYVPGQSLVAGDQIKAGNGLSFPGLEITWLDFGGDTVQAFSDMPNQYSEGLFYIRSSSGTVIFDKDGKITAVGDYDNVGPFSDGMALVQKTRPLVNWKPGELAAPPGSDSGYIDRTGKEVIPLGLLEDLSSDFHEGLAVIGWYGHKKGFIDKTGKIVIPRIYSDAGDYSEGLAPVQSPDTKLWGYIDSTGKLMLPMEYESATPFSENLAYVEKGGAGGYIDKTGATVIDFRLKAEDTEYSYIDRSFHDGLAVALDSSGRCGYIDKTGSFVIPAKYKETEPFTGGVAFVTEENPVYLNGYGSSYLINKKGERLTPLWGYSRYAGETMESGLIRVLYPFGSDPNQSIAMLNQYGAEVIPSDWNIKSISPFNEGYALLIGYYGNKQEVGLVKLPENINAKKSGRLIRVKIDGELLDFKDTDPVIENSRVLVPMREIFESLGTTVGWDPASQTASGIKGGTEVSLKIGDKKGSINGQAVELDSPALLRNGRTLVPARFIAESFHAEVGWDEASRTVIINTTHQ